MLDEKAPAVPVTETAGKQETSADELPDTPLNRLLTQPEAPASLVTDKPFGRLFDQRAPLRKRPGGFTLVFGVGLPVLSFLIETLTRICAKAVFDPLPTVWHHLLVCAVPLANLWAWRVARREDERARVTWLLWLANGLAVGIAIYYTILYLPVTPVALVALLFFGLGVLPLTPLLALIASALLTRHLWRLQRAQLPQGLVVPPRKRDVAFGVALAFVLLIAAELPDALTRIHLQMAVSQDAARSLRGVQWLRARGLERTLLRASYGYTEQRADLVGFLLNVAAPVSAAEARKVYYRVSGRPFDSIYTERLGVGPLFDLDQPAFKHDDGTGETMAVMANGLSMVESQMDGSLDVAAALGYLEWTLVFKNDQTWQQEARAHIALPLGGVVSRLTLWVNGEEREAAFASRGKVTAAYQQIVSQRRDPVLVTSSGPDRVQVQCFPVPPNGTMKIRLGITAPLTRAEPEQGWFRLPRLLERNFAIASNAAHAVWVEAKQPLETSVRSLHAEQPSAQLFAVRGRLPHTELAHNFPSLRVRRDLALTQTWTRDPQSASGEIIVQQAAAQASAAPQQLIFVIDGSQSMHNHSARLAETLAKLPETMQFKIFVAGDETVELTPLQGATAANVQPAAAALRAFNYVGGADNVATLTRAWDEAASKTGSAIVWLHGPQPELLSAVSDLQQRFRRRPQQPVLYELQTANGPNLIAEEFDGVAAFQSIARLGGAAEDLERLFNDWRRGATQLVFTRTKLKGEAPAAAKETSAHLARLWAFEEVGRLLATAKPQTSAAEDVIKLAAAYQLVTPVTGAVVLETKEQYQRAGLEPVGRSTVPTIPEPETWLLLLVIAALLGWLYWRRGLQWRTF
jgi:hypothetical protein